MGYIMVNGERMSGSEVEGNPTIPSGVTPTDLENVMIDSNYYAIPSGGGSGDTNKIKLYDGGTNLINQDKCELTLSGGTISGGKISFTADDRGLVISDTSGLSSISNGYNLCIKCKSASPNSGQLGLNNPTNDLHNILVNGTDRIAYYSFNNIADYEYLYKINAKDITQGCYFSVTGVDWECTEIYIEKASIERNIDVTMMQ